MIEVRHLTKTYGKLKAVDDVNLCAKPGEITVLLGPNGAGKSTTIKSIAALLKYEGEIKICGHDNHSVAAKKLFGYIPEAPVLYDILTVAEHVRFIANAYRVEHYEEKMVQYLELFDLSDKKDKMAKELSKGMKQKLSMMLALIISPQALLVDEPMVGLDPASIEDTLRLCVKLKEQGVSILISTHIIDVIDEIWDDAYIMDHGKIVQTLKRTELKEQSLKEVFFACVGEHHESAA